MNLGIKLLVAEDDPNLGTILKAYLTQKGYTVVWAKDGEEATTFFEEEDVDACILDVMMPVKDGFTVAKEIRKVDKKVPLIFLTAKNLEADKLKGFEIGADDYITKPFRMDVVVLRIEAILRRVRGKQNKNETVRNIGKFVFDTQKQMLTIDGEEKKLTTKEAELLTLLSNKVNELLPREYALKAIWIDDNYFNARSMDVYITKLRKLLSQDPSVQILNVHGKGYKLVISGEEA